MPRQKNPENRGLPERWRLYHGAYYFQVPPGLEHLWDGKKQFRLGKTLSEAYRVWTNRLETVDRAETVGDLLDRYALEVIPSKKPTTARRYKQLLPHVRAVFGEMKIATLEPQDIYKYVDKRSKKKTDEEGNTTGGPATARHEIALLSHAYTKAVEWGFIKSHPFKGEVLLAGIKPRDRYVEDWEIVECLALPAMRKRGSVQAIQALIRVRLLTGLRGCDLLRLQESNLKDDGIHIATSKTGKPIIYEWSDELRDAVALAKAARPVDISPFIFCNRWGEGYLDEETGTASGWSSMWQRFMDRVLAETKIADRFTEHDLRAKCASDAATLEHARALLAHADSKTTRRIYRRKPERVKPAR
jgi:integrase